MARCSTNRDSPGTPLSTLRPAPTIRPNTALGEPVTGRLGRGQLSIVRASRGRGNRLGGLGVRTTNWNFVVRRSLISLAFLAMAYVDLFLSGFLAVPAWAAGL